MEVIFSNASEQEMLGIQPSPSAIEKQLEKQCVQSALTYQSEN